MNLCRAYVNLIPCSYTNDSFRNCFKIPQLARYGVINRFEMLIYSRVNGAYYSGPPALHPSGRQSRSNLFPTDLSPSYALSRTQLRNFKIAS
jgi:hypothetical protein